MYRNGFRACAALLGLSLLLPIAAGGCSPQAPRDSTRLDTAADTGGTYRTTVDSADDGSESRSQDARNATPPLISLNLVDRAGYLQVLERHKGKVVLVDFWATWCGPCVQQFPHTVQLSREHRDRGLAVISVSMDDPNDEAKVKNYLSEQRAEFDNLLGKYGVGTEFAEAFEMRGDVPFYKLYDRAGQLRYQFSSDPSGLDKGEPITQIDRRLEELLAE